MAITRAQQFRQMLKDGNVAMQGGVKNYLGEQETVSNVPVKWKSGPNKPATELAYITDAEKKLLLKEDIHGSLKDGPNKGPEGIMSLDSAGDKDGPPGGFSGEDVSAAERGEKVAGMTAEQERGFRAGAIAAGAGPRDSDDKQTVKQAIELQKKFKQPFTTRFNLDLPTRRIAYDFFGNNPKTELRFISRLYNFHPEVYANLSPNLKSRFEETIAYDEDREFKDFDKFSYDDFTELTNFDTGLDIPGLQNFSEYAATYGGAPGLKFSGNVGNIEKFVTGKDPVTGETTYGYREINKDDAGLPAYKTLLPNQVPTTTSSSGDSYYGEAGNPFENRQAYRLFNKGGIADTVVGGEFDFESARQMYGLGKLVKKVTRTVKKIAKSPVGKAAILGAVGFGIPGTSFGGLLGRASFGGAAKGLFGTYGPASALRSLGLMKTQVGPNLFERVGPLSKLGPMSGIFAASALAGLLTPKPEDEEDDEDTYRGEGLDFSQLRPYGIQRFAEGGFMKEPVAKKTMPLLDMGGKEMDLRAEGGFVPIGRMEKADDVPARLSKNEFVFTADAVRNAGDGDVDKGAEVMYNMMKNLESGGDVSEESQGLEGARDMFQTSKRLEEVL